MGFIDNLEEKFGQYDVNAGESIQEYDIPEAPVQKECDDGDLVFGIASSAKKETARTTTAPAGEGGQFAIVSNKKPLTVAKADMKRKAVRHTMELDLTENEESAQFRGLSALNRLLELCPSNEQARALTPNKKLLSDAMNRIACIPTSEYEDSFERVDAMFSCFTHFLLSTQNRVKEVLKLKIARLKEEIQTLKNPSDPLRVRVESSGQEALSEDEALKVYIGEKDFFKDKAGRLHAELAGSNARINALKSSCFTACEELAKTKEAVVALQNERDEVCGREKRIRLVLSEGQKREDDLKATLEESIVRQRELATAMEEIQKKLMESGKCSGC